jgi:hypothetical protein
LAVRGGRCFKIRILDALELQVKLSNLSDEVTAANILGRRMANTALLIQALGGGWDRTSLLARPECCGKLVSNNPN